MQSRSRSRAGVAIALIVAGCAGLMPWPPFLATAAEPPASAEAKPLRLDKDEERRAGLVENKLEATPAGDVVALFGTVEANKDRVARIIAPVGGRMIAVTASLGDAVKPGDLMAELESSEGGEAQAGLLQAEAELQLARQNVERLRALVAGGSVARKEEQKAQSEWLKAKAARDAAAAKLRSYGIAAGDGAGRLNLRAPFAGIVTEKTAVIGEHVVANEPLFTIADLSSLWIEADLYERDLGRIETGAAATVTVAAFSDRSFTGTVRYLSSGLNRETRTAKARIELGNPDGLLKPGMFASISVAMPGTPPALRVPETALILLQGQMTVFVRSGEGFEPRPVETGARTGNEVTVTSGLEAGDQIVTSGAYALKARLLKSQIGDSN